MGQRTKDAAMEDAPTVQYKEECVARMEPTHVAMKDAPTEPE